MKTPSPIHTLSTYFLNKFNDWFVSDSGVWQTVLVCVAVSAIEFAYPRLDPHAFFLMAVLTVYSGVTQPALARAGRVSGEQQEVMLRKIADMEEQNAELLHHLRVIRAYNEDVEQTSESS